MNEIELVCFRMISALGAARSAFMEAMVAAKKGNFEEAQKFMEQAGEEMLKAHEIQTDLIVKEAKTGKAGKHQQDKAKDRPHKEMSDVIAKADRGLHAFASFPMIPL